MPLGKGIECNVPVRHGVSKYASTTKMKQDKKIYTNCPSHNYYIIWGSASHTFGVWTNKPISETHVHPEELFLVILDAIHGQHPSSVHSMSVHENSRAPSAVRHRSHVIRVR